MPNLDISPAKTGQTLALRFFLFGKLIPVLVFTFFGMIQVFHVLSTLSLVHFHPSLSHYLLLVSEMLYAVFSAILVFTYVIRQQPKQQDSRLTIRVVAFVATFMMVFLGGYVSPGPLLVQFPTIMNLLGIIVMGIAYLLEIFSLFFLRTSFSIIPEARDLVSHGPYQFVRHPIYLAEILAVASIFSLPSTCLCL